MSPGSAPSMVVLWSFLTLYLAAGREAVLARPAQFRNQYLSTGTLCLGTLFRTVTVFTSAFRLRGGEEITMIRAAGRMAARGVCLSLLVFGLVGLAPADTITISG